MKIQNNKDDFWFLDKDNESQEPEFSNIKKKFLLDNYWKTIPHVPDSEYYSHGE